MVKRIISAIIALPFLLAIIIVGGLPLYIAIMGISLIGLREFYGACQNKFMPIRWPGYIGSIIIVSLMNFRPKITYFFILVFILIMTLNVIKLINRKYNFVDISITLYGLLYIPFLLGHILLITKEANSIIIWLVFITAWGTDTFAYFSGYFFGRRKLCPHISPKKTLEGAIGGVLGSMISSFIFGYFLLRDHLLIISLAGIIGSIVAQIGDLSASLIKRYTNIKDFGNIMPGHGGILDRFDSILFTGPTIYYILVFLINS